MHILPPFLKAEINLCGLATRNCFDKNLRLRCLFRPIFLFGPVRRLCPSLRHTYGFEDYQGNVRKMDICSRLDDSVKRESRDRDRARVTKFTSVSITVTQNWNFLIRISGSDYLKIIVRWHSVWFFQFFQSTKFYKKCDFFRFFEVIKLCQNWNSIDSHEYKKMLSKWSNKKVLLVKLKSISSIVKYYCPLWINESLQKNIRLVIIHQVYTSLD